MPRRNLLVVALLIGLATPVATQSAPAVAGMYAEGLLETGPDSLRVASTIVSRTFDRGVKDMDAYTYLAKLVLQHTLALAEQHPAKALDYKRAALPMTYNLAANTWPGWSTPDGPIPVSDHHRKLGLEAAQLDVKLAVEVAPTPQRRFNSYWVLGAHLIADGRYGQATSAFETCRDLARDVENDQSATMAQGWIHLVDMLAGRDETAALTAIEEELMAMGDEGAFLARQYAAAYAIFADAGAEQP